MMRKGPHPLSVHLGIAMSKLSGVNNFAKKFELQPNQAQMTAMIRGIQMYQSHHYKPKRKKMLSVWQHGTTRLLYSHPSIQKFSHTNRSPLILVPSLVNKADIFDLSAKRSLMRWLDLQGIECFMLDWGDFIKNNEQDIDIDQIISDKIVNAIQYVSELRQKPVDVLGYCMGGTLLLGACGAVSDHIKRLILLAAPWDFHASGMELTQNIRLWAPFSLPEVQKRGYLPAEWTQALFASLDPDGSAQKFIRFSTLDQDSEEAKLFVLVEDWLNDGVNLPGSIAQHCIQEWFVANKTAAGEWNINGRAVEVDNIKQPVLIIASHKDKLVPFESATNLKPQLGNAAVAVHAHNCGHIGFIAGKYSIQTVWQPLLEWLQQD